MKKTKIIFGAVLLGAMALPLKASFSDMSIFPVRPVFKEKDRSRHINVINRDSKPAQFEMEWYYQRQTPDGVYENAPASLTMPYDVASMVRYSPRRVNLEPGGIQLIRLSLRRPPDLPDGEYRAYLKLRRTSAPTASSISKKPSKIKAQLNVAVNYAMPVIIRQGKNDASASIQGVKLLPADLAAKKPPMLDVDISRVGKFSTLGRVNVFWTPVGGQEKQIGTLGNFNIFPEIGSRTAHIALTEQNVSGGALRVIYVGEEEDEGKTFDEKNFPLTR